MDFGYANSIFYPELFLYPFSILVILGINVFTSYKLMVILCTFFTLVISFYVGKEFTLSNKKAYIISIIYTTSFYRLTDIYARGAVGEFLAIMFVPLVIFGIYDLIYQDEKKWFLICFGIFGIVNSHVLTYVMIVLFIIVMLLLNINKIIKVKEKILKVFLAGILSIMLSFSFILPYIEQSNSNIFATDVGLYDGSFMEKYAVSFDEFINLNFIDGDYYKTVGLFLIITSSLIFFIKKSNQKDIMIKMYFIGLILSLMTLSIFPWKKIADIFKFITIIQFPYRLDILASTLLALVSGYVLAELLDNKKEIFVLGSIIYSVFIITLLTEVKLNPNNLSYDEILNQAPIGNAEYIPWELNQDDISLYNLSKPTEVIDYVRHGSSLTFEYKNSIDKMEISIPLSYYKGYSAYIIEENGNKEKLDISKYEANKHVLLTSDEIKTGEITVYYKMTLMQKIGYILSYGLVSILIIYVIYNKYRNIKFDSKEEE